MSGPHSSPRAHTGKIKTAQEKDNLHAKLRRERKKKQRISKASKQRNNKK